MNQLLMAAARGARIEHKLAGQWHTAPLYECLRPCWRGEVRIHPDDEHLRFGPISTALRKVADGDSMTRTEFAFRLADEYEVNWIIKYENLLHRALFLLILAEALAEEGL